MPIQHIIGRAQQDAAIRARRLTWSQLFHRYVVLTYERTKSNKAEFEAVRAELHKRGNSK